MIKIKELRLGNWIACKKSDFNSDDILVPTRVLALTATTINGRPAAEFAPLVLTSEILRRAGFDYNGAVHSLSNGKITLFLRRDQADYVNLDDCQGGQVTLQQGVRHLHQVQNLVLSLTGKEIQIEL